VALFKGDTGAKVLLASGPGLLSTEVEAHQVLDALVAVLARGDQPQWGTVPGIEGCSVEVRREEHVLGGDVLPHEGGPATIGASGHDVRSRCLGDPDSRQHLAERDTPPDQPGDAPSRHAVELRRHLAGSQALEYLTVHTGEGIALTGDLQFRLHKTARRWEEGVVAEAGHQREKSLPRRQSLCSPRPVPGHARARRSMAANQLRRISPLGPRMMSQ
jgi:hypothetical protein